MTTLDAIWPHRGPCALCGHPDARHRDTDAVAAALRNGDDPLDVAEDHGLDSDTLAVVAAWGAGSAS